MLFYSDEDVDRGVVLYLRQRHDVTYPREAGTTARSDAWHLRQAALSGRILITVNHTDFKFLHRVLTTSTLMSGLPPAHAGIISVTRTPDDAAVWARAIETFVRGAPDLAGRLYVWHHKDNEWIQDAWRPDE